MAAEKPWPQTTVSNKDYTSAAVVIIGAGISGMCTAIDLITRNQCHNFVILERSSGVGGTWKDNKYPGCCCDVWSLLYSYSFEQKADWSREYPGQEEILDYLIKTAAKYNLFRYIRFNSTVTKAAWDGETGQWKTTVQLTPGSKDSEFKQEYVIASDFLVSAMGQLNVPKYPDIPGIDEYKGKLMHSSRWDWTFDLRGKRVALIGSGATAAQIAPEVAKEASHLRIYQRTPAWIILRLDKETPEWKKSLYRWFPPAQWRVRAGQMDFREMSFDGIVNPDSPIATFFKDQCLTQMKESLPGREDLWEKLTPKYNLGCKRVVISDDYYSTIAQDNVELETRPIQRFTENGIITKGENGEEDSQEFDLIVCATGFKSTQFMHPIDITGRNGKALADIWRGGAIAYKGVSVPDLPNFGMLYGPNTNLGHNSIILMIEAQSRYIAAMVEAVLEAKLRDQGASQAIGKGASRLALVAKNEKVDEYNKRIQETLGKSSFADPQCGSWYKDPKTGKITNNWSGNVVEYQKQMSYLVWDDYEDGDKVEAMRNGEKRATMPRVVEETRLSDKALMALSFAVVAAGVVASNAKRIGTLIKV